jgi:hypothetical protein
MSDSVFKEWNRLQEDIPAIESYRVKSDPDSQFKLDANPDPVNSPNHYMAGSIECIDAIEASASSAEAFRGYCKGNVQKYLWRMEHKGKPKEDALKAQWYLNKLISKL